MSEMYNNLVQQGENGGFEYSWNEKDINELITQFNFQLTQSEKVNIEKLENIHKKLLYISEIKEKKILYKLLAFTRDIVMGKGIYGLSYMMLYNYAEYNFDLFKVMLNNFVGYKSDIMIPYGSWKDCKYLIEYCEKGNRKQTETTKKVKDYVYTIMLDQLEIDYNILIENSTDNVKKQISLLGKWFPREKSRFKFMYEELAIYSPKFTLHSNQNKYSKAVKKLKTDLRKKIATLNRYLKTVQINQCDNTWREINFSKNVTSITMIKQKKAFLNIDNHGKLRNETEDRILCRNNLLKYIDDVNKGKEKIKAKNVDIYDYVKSALHVKDEDEKKLINESWKENGKSILSLKNFVAMIDTSASMECENSKPLFNAIGLGIRVAEKSSLGKRVLTFSANPEWINLENCKELTDMVKEIKKHEWGMNTNFEKAMLKILQAIVAIKMSPEEVEELVLAVFSDMQFDDNMRQSKQNQDESRIMFNYLSKEYENAGLKLFNRPYKLPHMLFWNLRETEGFPSLSIKENVSMLSGNSPNLLNKFASKGIGALKDITPWKMLLEQLDKDRYNVLIEFIK